MVKHSYKCSERSSLTEGASEEYSFDAKGVCCSEEQAAGEEEEGDGLGGLPFQEMASRVELNLTDLCCLGK